MNEELKGNLDKAHEAFFRCFGVDADGFVGSPYLKFASYPHVGSRYGDMTKLMVIGMDIGYDPTEGRIQSYECRRLEIEGHKVHKLNPHMSGTYVTAMHFLSDQRDEWKRWLERADCEQTPQALLNNTGEIPSENPLSYIAFTNYYKFLVVESGAKVQLASQCEEDFLVEEARVLAPDIVVLQSAEFRGYKCLLQPLSDVAKQVWVGNHPSVRGEKRRWGNYRESIELFESASE